MRNAGILIYMVIIAVTTLTNKIYAQQAGSKLGPRLQAYQDSIKNTPYKWIFPIWGKKLAKRGFELPLSGGIMLNPYFGSQEITISDLKVGLFGKDPVPLDFIKFGQVKADIQSVTVRPDIWILPFLDLYAIAGTTWTQTAVEVTDPLNFKTTANFFGYTYGVGTTVAGGINGFVTIVDLNYTWSKIEEIKGTIQVFMLTPRFGYNFRFQNKPQRSITLWVGAPRIFLNRVTEGTIEISDLGVSASHEQLEEMVNGTASWFSGLTPAQKEVIKIIG